MVKLQTCPATAKPSAKSEVASQTCKQTWNAAIVVEPCLAAIEAANVTQNVTAITLINNKKPVWNINKKNWEILDVKPHHNGKKMYLLVTVVTSTQNIRYLHTHHSWEIDQIEVV